ncbi:MAG: hypothetical protein SXQ77_04615, partial [Halobacteria archaeon]|nr:hypothetical protein [Halobacteria archaeon]
ISTDDAYDNARELRDRYADEDPEIVDAGQYDADADGDILADVMRVNDDFLVGTSSGANLEAAVQIAEQLDDPSEAHIVTMFCDRGDKYKNSNARQKPTHPLIW